MPRGNPENPRNPWKEVRLPNGRSVFQTAVSLKIDLRYAELRIWTRWNYERFVRLAKFLRVTAGELASIACIRHSSLERFVRRNRLYNGQWPDYAACVILTMLEAHCAKDYTHDVIENPLPDLSVIAPLEPPPEPAPEPAPPPESTPEPTPEPLELCTTLPY